MNAMPGLGTGDPSPAILRYLSSLGVHVRPGKLSPSQEKTVSTPARRLFGVPLHSLPLSVRAKGVPQFLVDACELLRLHLHTEGLFRKTGSVTRIEALRARLEAGENCLHMALPCDVATLVKQFLRGLLEPLVPAELQGPMCQVQQHQEKDRGPLTVLLTCLLPQASASTLRYFFGFLQDVAARCSQNKMDLANLAVIFTPNLFSSEICSQLDGEAEELLQTQAAVVELLIIHASDIGTVPQSLLGKVQAAFSDMECKRLSPPRPGDRRGGEVESRRKRLRRRSVGDIVTEALSRLKLGRALRAAPCPATKEGVCQGGESPNSVAPRTSFNSKRKASDELACNSKLSAKKRRSASDSGCSDPSNEEVFQQPGDAGLVQGSPGRSSDEDSPPSVDRQAPDAAVKCKNGLASSPSLDGVSRGHRVRALNGGTPGKADGFLVSPAEATHPPRQLRVLRRSLSWPEDLSARETAERGETDPFPDGSAVGPGDRSGLAEPERPGAEVMVTGLRQAGIPTVCVTLADSYEPTRLENGPHDVPNSLHSSEPDGPDDHSARAGSECEVPQSSQKRFTLNFQQPSSLANEEPNAARPKRKGGRRFGRSVSHESGLPLRVEEEDGCTAKKKGGASPFPKSPLQSFKAYGWQIFSTRKYWAMAFAGLRGRKEAASPSPHETVQATADSQDSLLGHRLEGGRHRYRRSPKSPMADPQLVAGQDSLDL